MIVLLVLVSALAISVESEIDWSTCGTETKCFCGSEMVELPGDVPITDEQKAKCLEFGMQNKFFSEDIALFQMQVSGKPTLKKLSIYFGPELRPVPTPTTKDSFVIFGCEFSPKNEPKLFGNEKNKKDFKISLFEKLSSFNAGTAICAVRVDKADKLSKFAQDISRKKYWTTLQVETTALDTLGTLKSKKDFFKYIETLCNPFSFSVRTKYADHRVEQLKNLDKNILSCEDERYTMKYANSSGEIRDMVKLECKQNPSDGIFYYYIHQNGEAPEQVEYPEEYSFFCAAPFSETCTAPKCELSLPKICPIFTPGEKGKDAKLTCLVGKWMIDEIYTGRSVDPVCKIDSQGNLNEAAFFFDLGGGYEKRDGSYCIEELDCKLYSNLALPCANENLCLLVDDSNDQLKCKNESAKLTVGSRTSDNETLNEISIFTCNKTNGLYQNGSEVIPPKSRVRCTTDDQKNYVGTAARNWTSAQIFGTIGGCFAFAVIAIIIFFVSYSQYQKRKSRLRVKGKDEWRKIKKSSVRIAHCKAIFAEIAAANLDTADRLLVGLDFIEMMLEAETEDVECWEEASLFLKRFHGSIAKLDMNIWHMFSRYMYLQAKKIIDKHGWLAAKPIRNKSRKGLIRAVAVKLLSFSMFDLKAPEAEELVIAGMQQLRCDAVEQYPHCGLLWSLAVHLIPIAVKVDENVVKFQLYDLLDKIRSGPLFEKAYTVPEDERIPAFGSIAYQAAFAIGAAPSTAYHAQTVRHLCQEEDNEKGNIPRGFLDGIAESIMHNPCPVMLVTTGCNHETDMTIVGKICKIVPTNEFKSIYVDKMMRIAIIYGRVMDAKRLQTRYIDGIDENEAAAPDAAGQEEEDDNDDDDEPPANAAAADPAAKPAAVPEPAANPAGAPATAPKPAAALQEDKTPSDPPAAPAPKPAAAAAAAAVPAAIPPTPTPNPAPKVDNKAPEAGKKDERLKGGAETPAAVAASAPAPAPAAATPAPEPNPAGDAAPAPNPDPNADKINPFADQDPDALINKLQHEQQDFQDALEQILESVRKWFARRTDMEEFKKTPNYPAAELAKLDNRISTEKKKNVEGDKKSNSQDSSSADEPKLPPKKPVPGAAAAAPAAAPPPAANPAAAAPVKP